MVLNASLLNMQNYEIRGKGKWCNPEKGIVVAIEKGAFVSPSTTAG